LRIGIDLGGTKTEGILLDGTRQTVHRFRLPTQSDSYSNIIHGIVSVVHELRKFSNHKINPTIGIGIPGTLSKDTGLVKNANTTCLIGKAFDKDMSKALDAPVRIANDADCFTLSETIDGAGSGYNTVFGVIIGTGVGGGLCVNQRLLTGPNSITGEWGHNPLPWYENTANNRLGPECYCGKRACIETYLSGPGLTYDHQLMTQTKLPAIDIIAEARQKNIQAIATMQRYYSRFAKAISAVINIIDPDIIVLGGGLSHIDEIYSETPKLWGDWVFSDNVKTKILKNHHGASSGVRGAAWLWNND